MKALSVCLTMEVFNTTLMAVVQGYDIIFNEDEENDHAALVKTEFFAEESVPRFTDRQFKEHFRMSPSTFEDFLNKLHSVTENRNVAVGHPEILLEKQAMITLWCLSNMESFRSVGDRFGVTKSTCWSILYRVCSKILNLNRAFRVISWPSRQKALTIVEGFRAINGLVGVIGCIDGSHIKIPAPKEHPNSYCNRKNYHSVLLQAVCDNRKLFTHVYAGAAGEPGSIHDWRLFEKSDLYNAIRSGEAQFPNDSFLVGDLAYKLTEYLIVGFKDNGFLTVQQKNFNLKLSQVRVLIENAFALLKGRFRRLKFMETVRLDLVCLLVVSACVLHNLCILNGDEAEDIVDLNGEVEEERGLYEHVAINYRENNQLAIAKRRRIMTQLEMV